MALFLKKIHKMNIISFQMVTTKCFQDTPTKIITMNAKCVTKKPIQHINEIN